MKPVLGLLLIAALPALADIQTIGLYSTGVDAAGNLLAPGTPDPHYSLVAYPPGTTFSGAPGSAVVQSNRPGTWVANTAHSQWIGPSANASMGQPPTPGAEGCGNNCYYDYRTQFEVVHPGDLLGEMWTSDNGGYIILDGISGFDTGTGFDLGTYTGWHAFSFSALTVGLHTMDFMVQNFGNAGSGYPTTNPTGLQVNLVNTNVPEPGTLVLFGTVLVFALALKRKVA